MKKLALMATNLSLSQLVGSLRALAVILGIPWILTPVHAADCSNGDVTCLIAAINEANGVPGEHTITLKPGIYSLQIVDNTTDGPNGLPLISGSIRIQASADDPPTVIERGAGAQGFRIFQVSAGGKLTLEGITVQRGSSLNAAAIFNRGVTTLQDTIITENSSDAGAIINIGTLNVFRSVIANNHTRFGPGLGGILNEAGGNLLIEDSTIAHNGGDGGGGIQNRGALVVRNSSIVFNSAGTSGSGGGIQNSGSAEILNSTVAKNSGAGSLLFGGGGGIANFGQMSITNSTIRENLTFGAGGGIFNSGMLKVQNTIVAGNTIPSGGPSSSTGPDCSGTITSLGNNLVGDPSGCSINFQPSDLMGDPGLGALVGTGDDDLPGKAFYPVLAGSPLIDKGNPNACLQTDQLGLLRIGTCDIGAVEFRGPMLVSVDIRPKSDANRINPNSNNNINVAIFSANGFDATAVDPNTVRFGATGTEAAPIQGAIRDVDGDGLFDMVLRFAIPDTGIMCGDTSASLTGQTSQGLLITGSSPIKTVQCPKQNARN